jgi:EAL domain-containing protein (putative c-di-GMP-specific phosphodiesterase class I)
MTDQRQYILLCDDDEHITEALSITLERAGRTVIVCSDIDAAELALSHFPITHIVSDVQFTGEFGFEGLHFLNRVRSLSPSSPILLMTGHTSESLRRNAIAHGASDVLSKPFATEDLENALARVSDGFELTDGMPYETIRIPSIDDVMRGEGLSVAFQPIVRFTAGRVSTFAYEALTRVDGNWCGNGPTALFDYAERRGRLSELNIAAMERAIEHACMLPADTALFINIDPLTFSARQLVPALQSAAERAGIALDRIVLEVTERCSLATDTISCEAFSQLHSLGVRFALDDHGSAYSHLLHIRNIRPSFIKISNAFGTDFENDATKQRIVRNTVALAKDLGCETILEGIETSATVQAAIEEGVRYAQGFHFSRARAASHWTGSKSALWAA